MIEAIKNSDARLIKMEFFYESSKKLQSHKVKHRPQMPCMYTILYTFRGKVF